MPAQLLATLCRAVVPLAFLVPPSVPYADLERIPEVIAVAGGNAKTEALRSVLRGRAVTSVITDTERQPIKDNRTNHQLTFDTPQTVQDVLRHQSGMSSRITS